MKIEKFTGINNRQPIDRIKPTEDGALPVRDAVNVDLSTSNTFQRRPGIEQVIAEDNCRCLFASKSGQAYFAAGNLLFSFNGEESTAVASIASAHTPVAFADSPLGVIWSDGFSINLIRGGLSQPVAPAMPNPEPMATPMSGGSMRQGVYGVSFASERSDGQRSAMTTPQFITVSGDGFIRITASGHTQKIAVFVTAADGEIFYRAGTLAVGQTSLDIVLSTVNGEAVNYWVMDAMPAGNLLTVHNGRLLSIAGKYLYISLPYAFGLYRPVYDYIPLPDDITLAASVEGGLYLATDKTTYFLPGGDITQANLVQVAPYGAIAGTLSAIPNSNDLMWQTPRGPLRASPDGSIALLADKDVAFPSATSGAGLYRETNGLRQYIASLSQSTPTPSGAAVAGCYMDAEVIAPI
jgi:hypothetical protein